MSNSYIKRSLITRYFIPSTRQQLFNMKMTTVEKILLQKAVRITPMRQLVLEFLLESNRPMGLVELENAFPKSDRVTIYRTLKTFEEKGIVHCIDNGVAEMKYALCKEHCAPSKHTDLHPHFHCLKCGQISCIETVTIPEIQLPDGFSAKEMTMTIKGICSNCH